MAFRGASVEFPLGSQGMDSRKSTTRLAPGSFSLVEHADFTMDTLKKRGGNEKWNDVAVASNPRVLGLFDFWINAASQHILVATGDGTLFDATGGVINVSYKTGLGSNKLTHFNQAFDYTSGSKDKAFAYSGFDPIQVYDGSAVANLATPPADWSGNNQPIFGLQGHVFRHWAFGNANRPSFLYYSANGNPTNFTATGSGLFDVYGIPITGLGENLTRLFSFTEGRIFNIDTTDVDIANWRITPLDAGGGTRSPFGIVNIPNDLLFVGPDGGIRSLIAVQKFGDFTEADISGRWLRDWIEQHMNRSVATMYGIRSMYDTIRRVVYFAVAIDSSATNNCLIKGALPSLQTPDEGVRWSVDPGINAASLAMIKVNGMPRPFYGDYNGYVWALDGANLNDEGAPYTFRARSGDHDLGLPKSKKIFKSAEVIFRPTGEYTAEIDYYVDFALRRTAQFTVGGAGDLLDDFDLDEDELAVSGLAKVEIPLTGAGEWFGFELRQGGLDRGLEVEKVRINFTLPAGQG